VGQADPSADAGRVGRFRITLGCEKPATLAHQDECGRSRRQVDDEHEAINNDETTSNNVLNFIYIFPFK
jgi:hypothetical protein